MSGAPAIGGNPIQTKAELVAGTEDAFQQIRTEKPDSPPESFALLEAGLTTLRSLRDNPAVPDNDPRTIRAMAELTYAISAAAGINRLIVLAATKPPAGCKLN